MSKIENGIIVNESGNDLDETFNKINGFDKNEDNKLKIVCYCSVGYRSSSYIDKLAKYIKTKGRVIPFFSLFTIDGFNVKCVFTFLLFHLLPPLKMTIL